MLVRIYKITDNNWFSLMTNYQIGTGCVKNRQDDYNKLPRNSRHGFTLIELLVVISIIAVLMSIMMPALKKAREQARTVVCQTNLKSQSLASNLYSLDNNDAMVVYQRFVSRTDQYIWANDISPYIDSPSGAKGAQGDSWYGNTDKILKIFTCPSQREKLEGLNWWLRYGMSFMAGSRKISNNGDSSDYQEYKRTRINRPEIKILFGDTTDNTNKNLSPKFKKAYEAKWADPVGWVARHYFSLTTEGNPGVAFIPPADRHEDANFVFISGNVMKKKYSDVQLLDTDTTEQKEIKLEMFNARGSDRAGGPWVNR